MAPVGPFSEPDNSPATRRSRVADSKRMRGQQRKVAVDLGIIRAIPNQLAPPADDVSFDRHFHAKLHGHLLMVKISQQPAGTVFFMRQVERVELVSPLVSPTPNDNGQGISYRTCTRLSQLLIAIQKCWGIFALNLSNLERI